MPAVGMYQNYEIAVYGTVTDAFGAPMETNVLFVRILSPYVPHTVSDLRGRVVKTDASGNWEMKMTAGEEREFVVGILDDKFSIRVPSEPGRYALDSLILE